jgi:thiamine-phosphate pyrophosphorylase
MTDQADVRAEKARAIRGLYCITAEMYSCGRSNIEVVRAMLAGGAGIIQYREKDMPMLRQYRQCVEIRKMTADAGALLIIDDHIDLALAVGADGVHIGQDDLPIEKARHIAGDRMLIGLSTHSPEQALAAAARGADYIGVGPLFETHTKKDVCAPVGLAYLDYAVKMIGLPLVAIGGIKPSNIGTVLQHGAKCIALVTGIVGEEDIKHTVSGLQDEIRSY